MESLSDRLKALGLVQASNVLQKKSVDKKKSFEEIIQAKEITNMLGSCYFVETLYPWNYHHGRVIFEQSIAISFIADAGKVSDIKGEDISKLLFLDTETTGLAGGTGTLAFLVGVGFFNEDGFLLKQFILQDPSQEPAMLLEISNLVEQFTGLVTFNGKAFDIPLLSTRYVMNRFPSPFGSLAHLDLLFLARKLWKNRLQSRALQDLEQEILNIPRTKDEVPGWMIPQIYFDYLHSGDASPLRGVIYHNGMDILSLAALFIHVSHSFDDIASVDQFDPVDYFSFGQLFHDLGILDIAEKIFSECINQNLLNCELRMTLFHRLGNLYKRTGNYEMALQVWQQAAHEEDIDSLIELAKYFEHNQKECETALFWTENAVSILMKKGYHSYQVKQLGKELSKRKGRLSQKLGRKSGHVSEKNS